MAEYRIVRDTYAGYEVQARRWWFPIWVQCWNGGPTNTHSTIEQAEEFALNKAGGGCVKHLGRLSKEPSNG